MIVYLAYIEGTKNKRDNARYSLSSARLRELEQVMVDAGMVRVEFKRTVGRKPKPNN